MLVGLAAGTIWSMSAAAVPVEASGGLTLSNASVITEVAPEPMHRVRKSLDDIGSFTLAADPAYPVEISSIAITFTGTTLSNGQTFSVELKTLPGTSAQTCSPTSNTCAVTFAVSPTYIISGSASKTFKVRVNSTNFYNGVGTEGLSAYIANATDVAWSDGVTSNIPLEANVVPLTIADVSYE